MTKLRVIETNEGIQGEFLASDYDQAMKKNNWLNKMEANDVIKSGIDHGKVLEIGPGPGYVGLEWLKRTNNTFLYAIEISPDMINIATKNAREYGLKQRVKYVQSDAQNLPFENNTFDAVFSCGSLHEWAEPIKIFNEINRVLKHTGRYLVPVGDLKRNINPILVFIMKLMVKSKTMKQGLISSLNAAYLKNEIEQILKQSKPLNFKVTTNAFGLEITGCKAK